MNNVEPAVPASTVVIAALPETEELSSLVVAEAVRLTSVAPRSELHVVHVVDLIPGSEAAVRDNGWGHAGASALRRRAERHLAMYVQIAERALGRPVHGQLAYGRPAVRVVEAARSLAADYVVIGPVDRSLWQRAVFGSAAEAILREAPCTVVLARPAEDQDAPPPVIGDAA